jgi:isopropylmalate/homocitrate/citramalate synthase
MKKSLVLLASGAGVVIGASAVALIANAVSSHSAFKVIARETGIDYKEIKDAFDDLAKKIKKLKKKGVSDKGLVDKCEEFYDKLSSASFSSCSIS